MGICGYCLPEHFPEGVGYDTGFYFMFSHLIQLTAIVVISNIIILIDVIDYRHNLRICEMCQNIKGGFVIRVVSSDKFGNYTFNIKRINPQKGFMFLQDEGLLVLFHEKCMAWMKETQPLLLTSLANTRLTSQLMFSRLGDSVIVKKNTQKVLNYHSNDAFNKTYSGNAKTDSNPKNFWENLRTQLIDVSVQGLGEPHGSLLVGILFGVKQSMPNSFYEKLVATGTLHIIAASGFNITVIAKVLLGSLGRFFGKKVLW